YAGEQTLPRSAAMIDGKTVDARAVPGAEPHSTQSQGQPMSISTDLALAIAMLALASIAQPAAAATAPNLGTAAPYGVASSTFTNSNTSPQTIINGDVCYTTPPSTPPLMITGTTRTPCPAQVGLDQNAAIAGANGQACTFLGAGAITLDSIVIGANPPGTIPPGCYTSGG